MALHIARQQIATAFKPAAPPNLTGFSLKKVRQALGSRLNLQVLPTTQQYRWMSKTSNPLGFEEDRIDDDAKDLVLYERSTDGLYMPRYAFWVSSCSFAFWVWYVVDFAPTMNASGIEALQIHPAIPAVGLGMTSLLQFVTTVYPRRLISKLSFRPATDKRDSDKLLVYSHALPMVRPSSQPAVFPYGHFGLPSSSVQANNVVRGGDVSRFKGFMYLYADGDRLPFILHVSKPNEVLEHDMLLESILQPSLRRKRGDGPPTKGRGADQRPTVRHKPIKRGTQNGKKK